MFVFDIDRYTDQTANPLNLLNVSLLHKRRNSSRMVKIAKTAQSAKSVLPIKQIAIRSGI